MATKLNKDTEPQDATREHNVRARKDAISEGLEQLYQLDKQIAAAIEKHVKHFRDDKSAIKERLREDYQIPSKLLNARYASYKLERFADDTTLDVIREMFEALPVGGSVDLVEAAERAAE